MDHPSVQRLDAVLGQHHELLLRGRLRQVCLHRRGQGQRSGGNRAGLDLAQQPDPHPVPVLGLEDLQSHLGPADPLQPVGDSGKEDF